MPANQASSKLVPLPPYFASVTEEQRKKLKADILHFPFEGGDVKGTVA
jgi:hypothetical protein